MGFQAGEELLPPPGAADWPPCQAPSDPSISPGTAARVNCSHSLDQTIIG